jgi:protein gp37
MARNTNIQWCDDTVNPVMGCDGCELFPKALPLIKTLLGTIETICPSIVADAGRLMAETTAGLYATEIYRQRRELIGKITELAGLEHQPELGRELYSCFQRSFKCYAGLLHANRGGKIPGYAATFEKAELFPGRMSIAASARDLTGLCRAEKPWLDRCSRLIFISDMGDTLSMGVSFCYLGREIINAVASAGGGRHIWLWLTKRPRRMAEFGTWLTKQGLAWAENLIAMTSVTSVKTLFRVEQLKRVPSAIRGLSVEPLWSAVTLPLTGIDWVIVGGQSGPRAEPFQIEWALEIYKECKRAGIPFFLKQLGRRPFYQQKPLKLEDRHGGDWNEWPAELRIREFPTKFKINNKAK